MITRLYANNFRCLVAFEERFDSLVVLAGPNGGGKSSVFDAIRALRVLASGDVTTDQALGHHEHTNWLASAKVELEVDIKVGERPFTYSVHIEQVSESLPPRIVKESATCDGKHLFERDLEGVTFHKAGGAKTGFPLDWRKAALGSIQPAQDTREIKTLQEALGGILILRPNPLVMEAESKEESSQPSLNLANLTSWYRFLSQEQEWTDLLRNTLQEAWPDLRSFRLVNTGLQTKALQLRFDMNGHGEPMTLTVDQLSDGQKMMVGLYMMKSALVTGAVKTLLIDEPDNFVGLPELQPWMISLMESVGGDSQVILISHSAEILNLSGEQFGRFLWRDNHTSPTRIGPLRAIEGLSVSESIARGWVNG